MIRRDPITPTREQPQLRQLRIGPSVAEVVRAVERVKGGSWEQFRDCYGDWGRDLMLYVARRHCGIRLRELASAVGGLDYGSVAVAVQRFGKRLKEDRLLRQQYERVKTTLLQ